MNNIIVTAIRTHWRCGQKFEQGGAVSLCVDDATRHRLEADRELKVEVGEVKKTEAPARPEGKALASAIAAAVKKLSADADNLTQGGDVKITALEKELGFDVTRDEVNAAMDAGGEQQ